MDGATELPWAKSSDASKHEELMETNDIYREICRFSAEEDGDGIERDERNTSSFIDLWAIKFINLQSPLPSSQNPRKSLGLAITGLTNIC